MYVCLHTNPMFYVCMNADIQIGCMLINIPCEGRHAQMSMYLIVYVCMFS